MAGKYRKKPKFSVLGIKFAVSRKNWLTSQRHYKTMANRVAYAEGNKTVSKARYAYSLSGYSGFGGLEKPRLAKEFLCFLHRMQ